MDSIPFWLQAEFEALLRIRSVLTGLHPINKKGLRFYLDFFENIVFQKRNDKAWTYSCEDTV